MNMLSGGQHSNRQKADVGKHMKIKPVALSLLIASMLSAHAENPVPAQNGQARAGDYPNAYNEVWASPSKDAAGSMPLGNGQVGINLWAQENGELRFYISRTDSFSEISRLLKVGGVRIAFTPNPFAAGKDFRQELVLRDGVCHITAGSPGQQMQLRIFVDSDRPVVHVIGEAPAGIEVNASIDSWRTQPHKVVGDETWTMRSGPFDLTESADVFLTDRPGGIGWYHRNETSLAFESTLKVQSLEPFADKVRDPLLHRTFGGWMTGTNLAPGEAGQALKSAGAVRRFALRIAAPCLQAGKAGDWIAGAQKAANESADSNEALRHTTAWWHSYWNRSYVITEATGGAAIPKNTFPLRVGHDSGDGNRFRGEIGRRSVFQRALREDEISKLAGTASHDASPLPEAPEVTADGAPADFPADAADVTRPFTLEAWIKPDVAGPGGRIFDKLTAGAGDGFLLDIQSKASLRWIAGDKTMKAPPNLLKVGQWQHVAVAVDPTGVTRIYLDGKQLCAAVSSRSLPIAHAYALQRYVQACGGRGPLPIKFNGGIFTVEPTAMGQSYNPDFRQWGDPFWWQNTRHMYHPMAASGDLDMTDPLFDMFEQVRPLAEARTALYHGAKGAYFPETMTFWGTYANRDYGWNRKNLAPSEVCCGYWRYAWNQGPELVGLMLDRWDYQQDPQFLKTRVLPMAQSVLMYFDTRFQKDANGKIVIDPAQSVETYWTGVTNDTPTVASLIDITQRLTALPQRLITPEQRAFFAHMKSATPDLPLENVEVDGQTRRMLSPAQKYNPKRSNCENPELYAVWPARVATLNTPLLEEGKLAYAKRHSNLPNGWGYDGNVAALLGLADEAARILAIKCANSHPAYRWPATWGPNFDWLPDQNHGGNLLETTNLMLLQPAGDKIRLLPAWPKDWDVSFKLHAPRNTTVTCVYRGGKIESLDVTPQSRAADIILPDFLAKEKHVVERDVPIPATNVVVENCTVNGSVSLARLKLRGDTPQEYENVHYRNITLNGSGGMIVAIQPWSQYYDMQGQTPPQSKP